MVALPPTADAGEIWVDVFGATHVGQVREENQDDFSVCDLDRGLTGLHPENRRYRLGARGALFLVADGVGGVLGGKAASRLAVETIVRECLEARPGGSSSPRRAPPVEFLPAAVARAHKEIRRAAIESSGMANMSTTLTAAVISGPRLTVVHVGDSRAYLCRGAQIEQLTRDHTLVQQLVELGQITREEAAQREDSSRLVRALGFEEQLKADALEVGVCRGDAVLLCSDGLYAYVEPLEIRDLLGSEADLTKVCHELIDRANQQGGGDNITVIAARLTGEGLPRASNTTPIQVRWLSERAELEAP